MIVRSRSTLTVTIGAVFALCISTFVVSPATAAAPGPLSATASDAPERIGGDTTDHVTSSITSIAGGLQNSPAPTPSPLLAGEPYVLPLSGNVVVSEFIYPRTAAGASAARNFVHSDQLCAWNFCTIQSSAGGTRYKVFMFDPPTGGHHTVSLYNFEGLWDTHNHSGQNGGSGFTVQFYDDNFRTIGTYGPRRSDNVQWNPIYHLGFQW